MQNFLIHEKLTEQKENKKPELTNQLCHGPYLNFLVFYLKKK